MRYGDWMTCNTSPAIEQCKIGHSTNSINNVRRWSIRGIARNQKNCEQHGKRRPEPDSWDARTEYRQQATDRQIVRDRGKCSIAATRNFEIITTSAVEGSERDDSQKDRNPVPVPLSQYAGPGKIELLLDAERPQMHHHPRPGSVKVRQIQQHGTDVVPAKLVPVHQYRKQHENRCGGQDSIGTAYIKLAQIDGGSLRMLVEQDCSNQVARDHEEDPHSSTGIVGHKLWHRPGLA